MSICFACKELIEDDDDDKRYPGPKARKTLIENSIIRGDADVEALLKDESFRVVGHQTCCKSYGDQRKAKLYARRKLEEAQGISTR